VLRPELLLLTILSATVLLEFAGGFFPSLEAGYYAVVGGGQTVMDAMILMLVVAVAIDLHRRRAPLQLAGPFTFALLLLTAATITGAATGYFGGNGVKAVYQPLIAVSHLIVLPILVVNVAQGRRTLKIALPLIALLAAEKALVGLLLVATGRSTDVEGHAATYLDATANWICLLVLLALLAAAFQRIRLPLWAWTLIPLTALELIFSYRRSFWLGAILGIVVIAIVASGARGRRVVVPAVVVIGALGWWALAGVGSGTSSNSPVVRRVQSLQPSKVQANAQDRYRFDERRNVLANLREHPITGLGVGEPWRAPYALSVTHEGDRTYSHVIVLWYWLNLGALGALAYLALMATTLWTSFVVWRRHRSPLTRVAALGLFATMVSTILVETSGSFTGVEARFSVVFGIIAGLLATAYLELRPSGSAPAPAAR
jgi:hypothetical protein